MFLLPPAEHHVLLMWAIPILFASYVMHHASCIIHHASYIIHVASYIMHHAYCSMHHTSCTTHHASCIVHHTSCIIHHASCISHHAPCIICHECTRQVKAKMAAEAEQERDVYTQRASLAEEAKDRACEDRDHLQVSEKTNASLNAFRARSMTPSYA